MVNEMEIWMIKNDNLKLKGKTEVISEKFSLICKLLFCWTKFQEYYESGYLKTTVKDFLNLE